MRAPMKWWLRLRARPKLCGGVSAGTVEAIKTLAKDTALGLAGAKAVIDRAVFDGTTDRVLLESEDQAHELARTLEDSAPGILSTWVEPQQRVDDLMLVTPTKTDWERDAVADAWKLAGGSVKRLDRFWDPPTLPVSQVRLYGPDTFALVVAEKLSLSLLEPDPYLTAKCRPAMLGREVRVVLLGEASSLAYPCFLKPVVPKQFGAGVFASYQALLVETWKLGDATELLLSEVVELEAEARSFVLGGRVQACALYTGEGDVEAARETCQRIAATLDLPEASVVDVGLLENGAWVFVEANAAWGAGLDGCDPHSVLTTLAAATTTSP